MLTHPLSTLDTLGLLYKSADGLVVGLDQCARAVSGLVAHAHLCLSMVPPPGSCRACFFQEGWGLSKTKSDFAMASEVEKEG